MFGDILRCCEFVLSLFRVFQVFRVSLDACGVFLGCVWGLLGVFEFVWGVLGAF